MHCNTAKVQLGLSKATSDNCNLYIQYSVCSEDFFWTGVLEPSEVLGGFELAESFAACLTDCLYFHNMTDWLFVISPHDIAKTPDLPKTMQAQGVFAWHQPALPAKPSMRRFAFFVPPLEQIGFLLAVWGGGRGKPGKWCWMSSSAPTQATIMRWHMYLSNSNCCTFDRQGRMYMPQENYSSKPCMTVNIATAVWWCTCTMPCDLQCRVLLICKSVECSDWLAECKTQTTAIVKNAMLKQPMNMQAKARDMCVKTLCDWLDGSYGQLH